MGTAGIGACALFAMLALPGIWSTGVGYVAIAITTLPAAIQRMVRPAPLTLVVVQRRVADGDHAL